MHSIAFDALSKRFGSVLAVDDLTFTVEPGRVTGFLGRNGAGKSTTMRCLLGLTAPTSGRATVGGRDYRDLDDPLATVGVILEHDAFHPARTGRRHLRWLADVAGASDERIDEVLGLVGLDGAGDRRVGEYSLGMQQRLGLAAALLADPPVLVLDEPGNGLDPQGIRWLRDLLRWRASQGHTVFVSSHLLAEVQVLADELVVIDQGRLVTTQSMDELAARGVVVRSPGLDALRADVLDAGGRIEDRPDGGWWVTELEPAVIGEAALARGVVLHELSPQTASLETAFLSLTDHASPPPAADSSLPPPAGSDGRSDDGDGRPA